MITIVLKPIEYMYIVGRYGYDWLSLTTIQWYGCECTQKVEYVDMVTIVSKQKNAYDGHKQKNT